MSNDLTIPEKFGHNIRDLSDLLFDMCEDISEQGCPGINLDMITIAVNIIKKYENVKILDKYIINTSEYWDQILVKDRSFFEDNVFVIFGDLPVDKSTLENFKSIGKERDQDGNLYVDDEYVEELWEYFHALTKLSIKHLMNDEDEYNTLNFMSKSKKGVGIDLEKHKNSWQIV